MKNERSLKISKYWIVAGIIAYLIGILVFVIYFLSSNFSFSILYVSYIFSWPIFNILYIYTRINAHENIDFSIVILLLLMYSLPILFLLFLKLKHDFVLQIYENASNISLAIQKVNYLKLQNKMIVILCIIVLTFPIVIVQVIQTPSQNAQIFNFTIKEKLNETYVGDLKINKLQYFLGDCIAGTGPYKVKCSEKNKIEMVILIEEGYTKGIKNADLTPNHSLWGKGNKMNPDVYFGDQYLFFERNGTSITNMIVYEIKGLLFWPNQEEKIMRFYYSPIINIAYSLGIIFFPLIDETGSNEGSILFSAFVVQAILLILCIYLLTKKCNSKKSVVIVLLVYSLISMILTIPEVYYILT